MSNEYKGKIIPGCDVSLDETKIQERLKYIKQYIKVINSLGVIETKIINVKRSKNICPGCSKEIMGDGNGDKYLCSCGFSEDSINHSTEYNDVNRLVPTNTVNSKQSKPFLDWLDRFLCRSGDTYPQIEMFEKFDIFCMEHNFPNRYDVLAGFAKQPDSSVIISLLQRNGYSKFYIIKNLIRRDYYGWNVPEITPEQESQALDLYLSIQEKYPQFKSIDRKTNISFEIIGYACLKMVGVNLSSSDFKIPATQSTIEYSKDTLINIFLSLGYEPERIPEMNF